MNLKSRLLEMSGAALIAALLGCSMSLTLLDALSVSFSTWQVILTGALTSLVCAAFLLGRIPALISAVCLGGGLGLLLAKNVSIIGMLKETLIALLTALVGGEGSLNEHALTLMIVMTVALTLISFLLTRLTGGVYPALLLFMFVLLGGWYVQKRFTPVYIIPGLISLAVLYSRAYREGASYHKAVPAALIAAVIAVAMIPAGEVTWEPLANAAAKVRELFNDYFMFTDPRTVYSVSSDGYQPQGEVLGGPAEPRDAEIMKVKTDRMLFMRGSVRRTYTGYSWVDNSLNSRYLYLDPTRQALKDSVFDNDLAVALGGALEDVKVSVEMLNAGTSTLFVPHRLRSLSLHLDLVAYYNDSGEVFITRGVEYGDHYELTASMITATHDQLERMTRMAIPGSDLDFAGIEKNYMNIPVGLEDDVYWLTQDLIDGLHTPYEKARAIQQHLLSDEYTYRLDVELPPQGRDFVSYFLLDSKEGYCTYYASAMAIMARLAGLPSRYVEGYLVSPDPSGETIVTGEDAHAWVEIYFEGVGWIPFDATPGDRGDRDQPDENEPTPTPTPTPTPSPTPRNGNQEDDGSNDAETTPTPSPSPTPEPEHNPQDTPEDTPTPPPENEPPAPTEPPADQPDRDQLNNIAKVLMLIFALLLLILLISLYLRRRWIRTDPVRLAKKQKSDRVRLMVWYRAVLTLLMRSGFVPEGGETPAQFAQRVAKTGMAPEMLIELARVVERQQYARSAPSPKELQMARGVYERLLMQLKPAARLRWHTYRMFHGFGSFHQIP